MESWVWILIGFLGGIIVYAILNLIFAKDPSDELEKLADERAAELAKAEMKTAVLQDKLVEAETARDEMHEKAEAECQQRLLAADTEFQQKLTAVETDYQNQMAAAEDNYQAQLAKVESEFANLKSTFAEKAAEIGAVLAAAGMGARAVAKESDAVPDGEQRVVAYAAENDLLESAVPAEALAAAMAVDIGEDEILEPTAKVDQEQLAEYQDLEAAEFESEASGEEERSIDEAHEALDPLLFEEEEAEDDSSELGLAAAAGVAAAAIAAMDDEFEPAAVADDEGASDEEELGEVLSGDAEFEAFLAGEIKPSDIDQALAEIEFDDVFEDEPFAEEAAEADSEQEISPDLAAAAAVGLAGSLLLDEEATEIEDESASAAEEEGEPGQIDEALLADEEPAPSYSEAQDPPESIEVENEAEPLAEMAETAEVAALAAAVEGIEQETIEQDENGAEDEASALGEAPEPEEALVEDEVPEEPAWPVDDSVWTGEYFNNMKLEGEPVLVREDADIDFDWEMGSPAPEINPDSFSVRWKRTADLPPGLYRFTVTSDDGARLWVNDRLVISAWYDHTAMTFRREIELAGGPVELRLEYYEHEMTALVRVSWERIG